MGVITILRKPDSKAAEHFFKSKNDFTTGPVEVSHFIEKNRNDVNVVDVREEADFAKGHIPGAVNLPKTQWENLQGLAKDKTNVLYCYTQTCHLASKAGQLFASKGYPVMEMEGGFEAWKNARLPIETPASQAA